MGDHVLLVGMMGAGKTTLGGIVAGRLRRPFFDSDAQVMAKTGVTVPEIFAERGEAAFRAEEKMALARALTSPVPAVIGVAGGAVLDPDSRRRIRRGGVTIWLRADPSTLARRVGSGEGRPLLADRPVVTMGLLDAARRPVYAAVAGGVVDVDCAWPLRNAERVARLALELLAKRCPWAA